MTRGINAPEKALTRGRSRASSIAGRRSPSCRERDSESRATAGGSARSAAEPCGPPILEVVGVTHRFDDVVALDEVSIVARQGEFLTILGQSGSGKTTLLRIISGLETPTQDRGPADRRPDVPSVPAADRNCTTVFQHYALFPHMSVGENVEYGLKVRGVPKDRAPRAGDRGAGAGPPRRQVRPPRPSAERRRAPARGARPGAGDQAGDPAARRAARRARREAPPRHAGRAAGAAQAARHDLRLHHPQPGRGAHHERPGRS